LSQHRSDKLKKTKVGERKLSSLCFGLNISPNDSAVAAKSGGSIVCTLEKNIRNLYAFFILQCLKSRHVATNPVIRRDLPIRQN